MTPPAASNVAAVLTALRTLVVDQRLPAGSRLNQGDLARTLEISRTPVKLALAQLKHDGLVEQTSSGRMVLRSFSPRQVADSMSLRGALEGAAARRAAAGEGGSAALGQLDSCCRTLEQVTSGALSGSDDSLSAYLRLNEEFHKLLVAASGSDALASAYERLLVLPFACPSVLLRASGRGDGWLESALTRGQAQHRAILAAIRERQDELAERLMRDHVEITRRRFTALLMNDPAYVERLPGGNLVVTDSGRSERAVGAARLLGAAPTDGRVLPLCVLRGLDDVQLELLQRPSS